MTKKQSDRTDSELQAMLRAEIVELRLQLAQRETEIIALLQMCEEKVGRELENQRLSPGLLDWWREHTGRIRKRFTLRRQVKALADSALFEPIWYAKHHPECGGPEMAAVHYLSEGSFLGFDPSPSFSTRAYYRANPDVAEAGWPALSHYLLHGKAEGRQLRPSAGE